MTDTTEASATGTMEPVADGQFMRVRKRQLHGSATNPRKEFPEPTIEEMRASVAAHGVIQPLIVRRCPEKDRAGEPAFEIVAGERRFRGGSRVEGFEWFPVIVRELTDMQVREIQLIENLQREDVSPYDEAVGYASLLELKAPEGAPLYTVERIAEKIGKVVTYVRNRLKLQRTPKVLLDALRRGEVGTRLCEMVGRIPHAEDRERCAAEVLEAQHDDRPMTQEEAMDHIREHYLIPLGKAPFDRKDEGLLPKAGSCEGCRFRTGKDPELAEDLAVWLSGVKGVKSGGIDPNMCQNPKCYRDKCEAHLARVKLEAPALVLTDAEVRGVFNDYGNVLHGSKLKLVTEKPEFADVGHYDSHKLKAWGDYARNLGVPVRLAKNPRTGRLEQLVDVEAVKEAERQAGTEKPVFLQKGAGSKSEGEEKKTQLKEKRRREIEAEEIRMAFDRVSGALVGQMSRPELLMILGQAVDHQGIDVLLRWMGIKAGPAPKGGEWQPARAHKIAAIVGAVGDDAERYDREAILILVLMAQFAEVVSYHGIKAPRFAEFAKMRGVDLKEVSAAAKATVKERRLAAKAAKRAPEAPVISDQSSVIGETVDPAEQLADDLRRVVEHFGRIGGTASVDTVKITQQLGLPTDRATGVINELRGRRMIVMGCLDRDSAGVKEILEAGKGTESLEGPEGESEGGGEGESSADWASHPDYEKREKMLGKLEKQVGMWGEETIFDAVWVKAWIKGVKSDDLAWDLLEEAVKRGILEADQVVLRPE